MRRWGFFTPKKAPGVVFRTTSRELNTVSRKARGLPSSERKIAEKQAIAVRRAVEAQEKNLVRRVGPGGFSTPEQRAKTVSKELTRSARKGAPLPESVVNEYKLGAGEYLSDFQAQYELVEKEREARVAGALIDMGINPDMAERTRNGQMLVAALIENDEVLSLYDSGKNGLTMIEAELHARDTVHGLGGRIADDRYLLQLREGAIEEAKGLTMEPSAMSPELAMLLGAEDYRTPQGKISQSGPLGPMKKVEGTVTPGRFPEMKAQNLDFATPSEEVKYRQRERQINPEKRTKVFEKRERGTPSPLPPERPPPAASSGEEKRVLRPSAMSRSGVEARRVANPPRWSVRDAVVRSRQRAQRGYESLMAHAARAMNSSGRFLRRFSAQDISRYLAAKLGSAANAVLFVTRVMRRVQRAAQRNPGLTAGVTGVASTAITSWIGHSLYDDEKKTTVNNYNLYLNRDAMTTTATESTADTESAPENSKSLESRFKRVREGFKNFLEGQVDPTGLNKELLGLVFEGTGSETATSTSPTTAPVSTGPTAVTIDEAMEAIDEILGGLELDTDADLQTGPAGNPLGTPGGRLYGSASRLGFARMPLGQADMYIPKSSPQFDDETGLAGLRPADIAYRLSLGYQKPFRGDRLSERVNDISGERASTFRTPTEVRHADPYHPSNAVPPYADSNPKRRRMGYSTALVNAAPAIGLTTLWERPSIREDTRMAESFVALDYDTRAVPAVPANVDTFTSIDARPYRASEVMAPSALGDAPEVVGIGFDEKTFSRVTQPPTSTADDIPPADAASDNVNDASLPDEPLPDEAADAPVRAPRRIRDEVNVANQLNPDVLPVGQPRVDMSTAIAH